MIQRSEDLASCPSAEKAKLDNVDNMAAVCHEIRNPLNVVIGLSHLLQSATSMEDVKNYTEGLKQTSENLMEMLNKLMDFSQLRSGNLKMNLKPVALQECLASKMSGQRLIAEEKDLNFFVDVDEAIPPSLLLDPVKLGQVVLNLVSNSIKFTNNGYVGVRVALIRKTVSEVQLLFTVEDTGMGISKEHLEKIFNAFYQGHVDTNVNFGGTGLGLSISRQLVEVMGGNLVVESEPGKGSKFMFMLNVPIDEQEEIQPCLSVSWEPLKGLRVLLVDDSELNRMVAQKLLESKEMLCTPATNGVEALELLSQRDFDVVLTDLRMSQMNGYELLGILRESDDIKWRNLPVIALTGYWPKREGEELKRAGFSDHLLKPFKPEELFNIILKQADLALLSQK